MSYSLNFLGGVYRVSGGLRFRGVGFEGLRV